MTSANDHTAAHDPSAASITPNGPVVEVLGADLQGPGVVFCPNPKMPLWSGHPKVFLDVAKTGTAACPYCGTVYKLKAGEKLPHH